MSATALPNVPSLRQASPNGIADGTGLLNTGRKGEAVLPETPRGGSTSQATPRPSVAASNAMTLAPNNLLATGPSATFVATCPNCATSFHAHVASTVHFLVGSTSRIGVTGQSERIVSGSFQGPQLSGLSPQNSNVRPNNDTYYSPNKVQLTSPTNDQLLALLAQQSMELRALRLELDAMQRRQNGVSDASSSAAQQDIGTALFVSPAQNATPSLQPYRQNLYSLQAAPPTQMTTEAVESTLPTVTNSGSPKNISSSLSTGGGDNVTEIQSNRARSPQGYSPPDNNFQSSAGMPPSQQVQPPSSYFGATTGHQFQQQQPQLQQHELYDSVVNLSESSSHAPHAATAFSSGDQQQNYLGAQQQQPALSQQQPLLPPQLAEGSLFYHRVVDGGGASSYSAPASSRAPSVSGASAVNVSASGNYYIPPNDHTQSNNVSRSSSRPSVISAYQRGTTTTTEFGAGSHLAQPVRMVPTSSTAATGHQPIGGRTVSHVHHSNEDERQKAHSHKANEYQVPHFGGTAGSGAVDRSLTNVSYHSDVPSGLFGVGANLASGDTSFNLRSAGYSGGTGVGNNFYQQPRPAYANINISNASQPRSSNTSHISAATSSRQKPHSTSQQGNTKSNATNKSEMDTSILDGYCSYESMEYMRKIGIL